MTSADGTLPRADVGDCLTAPGALTVTPFLILCQARTGSNLVQIELSRRWPRIRCLGEEYRPNRRAERPGEITARVFAPSVEHSAVGCRVFYEHLSDADFRDLLAVPGMKVVHLRRHNILRRYVSLQIAMRDQVWVRHPRLEAAPIHDRAIAIDVDDFIDCSVVAAEQRTRLERAMARAGNSVLDVWYEDLCADLDSQLRRIAWFLGLGEPVSEYEPFLLRQNPEPLRLLVRNYASVRSRLAPTPMRVYLDPEDAGRQGQRLRRRRRSNTCWPTKEQDLLLRAALLPPGEAAKQFLRWRALTNPDDIDDGSRRLYPLLHRNLRRAGLETTFDTVTWAAYVRTSGRNQQLLRTLERVIGHLDTAGVPTLVLKGAALTVLHYRDRGARPMTDLDVMVPSGLLGRTLEVLREHGWEFVSPEADHPIERSRWRHAETLRQGDDEVDVHWHALAVCKDARLDTEFWDASVEVAVGGQRARALAPADQLLHAFAHGLRYNHFPPLRWVADAHMVITSSGSELDWNRLLRLSTRYRLGAYTSAALGYLDRLFSTIVPPSVLAAAMELPVTRQERLEFELMTRTDHWLPQVWSHYRRMEPDRSPLGDARGFADEIRLLYNLQHVWQVPRRAVSGMYRRWSKDRPPKRTGDERVG